LSWWYVLKIYCSAIEQQIINILEAWVQDYTLSPIQLLHIRTGFQCLLLDYNFCWQYLGFSLLLYYVMIGAEETPDHRCWHLYHNDEEDQALVRGQSCAFLYCQRLFLNHQGDESIMACSIVLDCCFVAFVRHGSSKALGAPSFENHLDVIVICLYLVRLLYPLTISCSPWDIGVVLTRAYHRWQSPEDVLTSHSEPIGNSGGHLHMASLGIARVGTSFAGWLEWVFESPLSCESLLGLVGELTMSPLRSMLCQNRWAVWLAIVPAMFHEPYSCSSLLLIWFSF